MIMFFTVRKDTIQRFSSFILLLLLIPMAANAQIQQGGQPLAGQIEFPKSNLELFEQTIALNEEQEALRNQILTGETPSGQAMQAGFSIPLNYNPVTDGIWTNLGDSLWVWRLQLEVEKARSLGVILEDFQLENTSKLYIYNKDVSFHVGAFTEKNNNPQNLLSVQTIPGETIIIEYQEPIQPGTEKFTHSSFRIAELIYIVNGFSLSDEKGTGNADDCMINVNCSEGDAWQFQKRGVARLLMRVSNSWFWCSGSLINNTKQDGTPYLLTADHCGYDASFFDRQVWQFYFNLEKPECSNIGAPMQNALFGCELVSRAPLDGGSDFKLLRLFDDPPIAWRPYFNGWDINDIPAWSGVGIHHPAGDVKKISTFDGGVVSGGGNFSSGEVMAPNSAWRFSFVPTENGFSVTQGGSSGSPMFNQDGLIVGTLSGGSSSCSNPNGTNIYGKMSFHWDQYDEIHQLQLKPHLDPVNSGVTTLGGYDPYIENYPPPGFISSEMENVETVKVSWYKPGQAPNHPGWHAYTTSFVDNISHGPERATVFSAEAFDFSYPVSISKISHVFLEKEGETWDNDQFVFRIYDSNGYSLLYASPTLTAESLTEVVYELDSVLTFEDKFFVSVRSIHPTGHPSSAYNLTNLGYTYSYHGHATNWQAAGNNSNQFVYLTSVYVEGSTPIVNKEGDDKAVLSLNDHLLADDMNNFYMPQPLSNKWSDLPISYNIYRNNDHIHTIENEQDLELSFSDDISEVSGSFIKYHVTAVYDEGIESVPSNSTYVFPGEHCEEEVTEYPYAENFDSNELPFCWAVLGDVGPGWILSQEITVNGDNILTPKESEYFMFAQGVADDWQDDWLITPFFNISELDIPALKFYFSGNYTSANTDNLDQLNVYIGYSDNAFFKVWDSSESPVFHRTTSFEWIPVVMNLNKITNKDVVRVAFQYEGMDGDYFAIDKVSLFDATDHQYELTIGVLPEEAGEVYGQGIFIEGEKVQVRAYPNNPYFFENWTHDGNHLMHRPKYAFLMPDEDYHIIARFTLDNNTDVTDIQDDMDGFKVYPNPTPGRFTLESMSGHPELRVVIMNVMGQVVYDDRKGDVPAGTAIDLSLADQPDGIYFLMINPGYDQKVIRISKGSY